MKSRIIIVEDQLSIRKKILDEVLDFNKMIANHEYNPIVIENFTNFWKKLDVMSVVDNDIFILDIDLNTFHSGIDIGKKIREINSNSYIVYLTSFEDKAIEIINKNINPWAYITKTIEVNDFSNSIRKVLDDIDSDVESREREKEYVTFKYKNLEFYVDLNDVLYISALKGYRNTLLLKTEEEEILVNGILKDWKIRLEKMKKKNFYMNLRPYVINMDKIASLSRDQQNITFTNNEQLFLGVSSIDKIKKGLKEIGRYKHG
ncbi:LytTR family transcriptional regulator DNA-binding domain-containing protein [Enterococcus faecalis]|nr:LytTR family transcriptional regulator DNA-binding domain-containing protein [Enterococcus faecalis]EGO8064553.1 response regulator [Enterococcus faecalis]EHA7759258.1 response regulator [Enterococcus faecalis]EHK9427896.1 LytTR family transcriptional regulator DNA-binding domain-containing protein [Enterococcus faecalis]EHZ9175960.1 LytTR family transcriptional regulator DNA-binding domain-containing protein [Enterococcus faecalis]EKQ3638590.1 LytTR family transcriptional regulator DNA-bin